MMCSIATNIEKLALFCYLRYLFRPYVVRLEEKPLQRRNSQGCSGWAEDVISVSHLKMSEVLPWRGRSHDIWYRVPRLVYFLFKSLFSLLYVFVRV